METKLNPITCGRPWGARERREKYSEGLRGAVNSFKKLLSRRGKRYDFSSRSGRALSLQEVFALYTQQQRREWCVRVCVVQWGSVYAVNKVLVWPRVAHRCNAGSAESGLGME